MFREKPRMMISTCVLDSAHLRLSLSGCQRLQEWENSKKRQDAQLDRLEKGVGSLADMARGMQVGILPQRRGQGLKSKRKQARGVPCIDCDFVPTAAGVYAQESVMSIWIIGDPPAGVQCHLGPVTHQGS